MFTHITAICEQIVYRVQMWGQSFNLTPLVQRAGIVAILLSVCCLTISYKDRHSITMTIRGLLAAVLATWGLLLLLRYYHLL